MSKLDGSSKKKSSEILVVDDDQAIREAVSFLLESEGYKVHTAENGLQALEWLKSNSKPCLILLDLAMPRMDGATFVEEMNKVPNWDSIPIVVLSGDGHLKDKTPSRVQKGILKPVDADVLLGIVKSYCR